MPIHEEISLVRMSERHLAATCRWLQESSELREQIDCLVPPTEEGNIRYWRTNWANKCREDFAIIGGNGVHVGNCGLTSIDLNRKKAELWIYLGESRGIGYGSRAIQKILARGFRDIGLNRISLRVKECNTKAISFYSRHGFRQEGVLRQDSIGNNGKSINMVLMSLLLSEFRESFDLTITAPTSGLAKLGEIKGEDYYYSRQQLGIDRRTKNLIVNRCATFLQGPVVLDLGFVDGSWTNFILHHGWKVEIVEGSKKHVDLARSTYQDNQQVTIHHVLFESFIPSRKYDCIIAGDILRYIKEPIPFLTRLRDWLTPGGRLIVTVPNTFSLHRRIGTLLGLETHPGEANVRDREVGNLRNYDRYNLRHELRSAGFNILELRGCFLKPLSSDQMSGWSDELLYAFLEIGDELENHAWFLYAICDK